MSIVSANDLNSINDSIEADNLNSIEIEDIQVDSVESDDLEKSNIDEKVLSDGESDSDSGNETETLSSGDENNESDVSSNPNEGVATNLELDNDADKENVKVGELVTWTLEAKNYGPYDAENTQVYDELPEGLEYVSHTVTKGEFNPETGIWKIGDLKVGEKEYLKIVTKAVTTGEKVNKANLTSDTDIIDPDECYEEEEIDVEDDDDDHFEKVIHSKQLPRVGNPIFLLILSLLTVLGLNTRKK